MRRLIDADVLEKDGWMMHRIVQVDEKTMSYQTKKPTDFPTIEPEQRWIPCSERPPQPNERHGNTPKYYLVQNEFCDMMVARFRKNRTGESWWEQMYAFMPTEDEIVAWMPLPEPYRGGEQDESD